MQTENRTMVVAEESSGFLDRTLRGFRRAWRSTVGPLRSGVDPDLPPSDASRLRRRMDACLEAKGGEVSARGRAAELGETYLSLDPTGRRRFLEILAEDYDIDRGAVNRAMTDLQRASERDEPAALAALRTSLVAPRVELLTRFNALSLGVKFLVDLRADLLEIRKSSPSLAGLDRDLQDLLRSWFDIGFLELKRITWDTPASLLEKLIEYEAVHAIRSWDDLKHRLDSDRRCYAFFHPSMPNEPLIFVQVALVSGLADNVQHLLQQRDEVDEANSADTAIFYSISNCQAGLSGVSFGNFLIKRVAADLSRDLPGLKSFATLSPVPGFAAWLRGELEATEEPDEALAALAPYLEEPKHLVDSEPGEEVVQSLLSHCARYLLEARRGKSAFDRVAHFHLSNGARVERLNWLADTSEAGLANGLGLMVNYRYELSDVDKNHEAYTAEGKITATSAVRKLLR
jgi:malonyl-CoA decarboxylase